MNIGSSTCHFELASSLPSWHCSSSTLSDTAVNNLFELLELKPGWYFGEGDRPALSEILTGLEIIRILRTYNPKNIEVFPGPNGDILISGHWAFRTIDILCSPGRVFDFDYEENGEEVESVEGITLEEIKDRMGARLCQPGKSSACSTHGTLAKKSKDIKARLLAIQKIVEFRSLTTNVFSGLESDFVPTSLTTILLQSRVSRQFSGGSTIPYCPGQHR